MCVAPTTSATGAAKDEIASALESRMSWLKMHLQGTGYIVGQLDGFQLHGMLSRRVKSFNLIQQD